MSSKIKCVCVGLMQTNCYIVDSTDSDGQRFLAVIDPGDSAERIESALDGEPTHIILTHSHFDHVGALADMLEKHPNAKFAVGAEEDIDPSRIAMIAAGVMGYFFYSRRFEERLSGIRKPDILLNDGDRIGPFEVLHTPGHTAGSICLYDKASKVLISGDTLFRQSCGRTDLGGSENAMRTSLARLLTLDGETKVLPGHGEPTVIEEEKDTVFL